MLIGETMRIALQSIRGNLFRAVLTMLGIVIGVGAVITMVIHCGNSIAVRPRPCCYEHT